MVMVMMIGLRMNESFGVVNVKLCCYSCYYRIKIIYDFVSMRVLYVIKQMIMIYVMIFFPSNLNIDIVLHLC